MWHRPKGLFRCPPKDDEQRPVAVRLFREELGLAAIDDWGEDEEFWWRDDPVVRVTYQVTLEDGNMKTGGRYLSRTRSVSVGDPSERPVNGVGSVASQLFRHLCGEGMPGHEVKLRVAQLHLGAPSADASYGVPLL